MKRWMFFVILVLTIVSTGCLKWKKSVTEVYEESKPDPPTEFQSGCAPANEEFYLPSRENVRVTLCGNGNRIYSFREPRLFSVTPEAEYVIYVVKSSEDASALNLEHARRITETYNKSNDLQGTARAVAKEIKEIRATDLPEKGSEIIIFSDDSNVRITKPYRTVDDVSVKIVNQLIGIQ